MGLATELPTPPNDLSSAETDLLQHLDTEWWWHLLCHWGEQGLVILIFCCCYIFQLSPTTGPLTLSPSLLCACHKVLIEFVPFPVSPSLQGVSSYVTRKQTESRNMNIWWEFLSVWILETNDRIRPPVMFKHFGPLGRVLVSNHNQYLDCCLIELYGFMMLGRHIAHFIISTRSLDIE